MSTLFRLSLRFTPMLCFFIFLKVPRRALRNYNFMKTYRSSEVRRGFKQKFIKAYLIFVMTSFLYNERQVEKQEFPEVETNRKFK